MAGIGKKIVDRNKDARRKHLPLTSRKDTGTSTVIIHQAKRKDIIVIMSATQVLLFLIVGKNEPLYEAEIHKRGAPGSSDAVARQNYFVVHSALDLVEKASWTTQNVRQFFVCLLFCFLFIFYLFSPHYFPHT